MERSQNANNKNICYICILAFTSPMWGRLKEFCKNIYICCVFLLHFRCLSRVLRHFIAMLCTFQCICHKFFNACVLRCHCATWHTPTHVFRFHASKHSSVIAAHVDSTSGVVEWWKKRVRAHFRVNALEKLSVACNIHC